MGRAARWLRGILGGGKKQPPPDPGEHPADPRPVGEKKKWGFGKSFREKGQTQPRPLRGATDGVVDERRGASYGEVVRPSPPRMTVVGMDDDEQSKRAIAVAAATAAVAEAAVAAAQAAAAVVKLTSSARGSVGFSGAASTDVGRREELAVVKIQSTFRGYLARRALRALKGLVKLQALVRGHIVRKQAAETLRCMQALVRVQARARTRRALQTEKSKPEIGFGPNADPPTPEKHEQAARVGVTKSFRSSSLKKNASKSSGVVVDRDRANATGWNWLDRLMEERYWDSREATTKAGTAPSMDDEKNAKILEVDTGKPPINQKRRSNRHHSCSTMTSDPNSHSFTTMPGSPLKNSTTTQQSVPSPSSVYMQQSTSTIRYPLEAGGYRESPHFYSASSGPGSSRRGPFTPAKSECSRSFFLGYSDYPNYMANTESSRAKVRSQSAPKQRPEFEKSSSMRRPSAHVFGQHALITQRPSSLRTKFANKAYPGSCRLDRLEIPTSY